MSKPFGRPEDNFTTMHNDIMDKILPACTGSEFKVLMVIFRKTRGWNKRQDEISYSQLRKHSGIKSNSTIQRAINGLEDKGMIFIKHNDLGETTTYILNMDYIPFTENVNPPITKTVTPPFTENVNTKDISLKKIRERDFEPTYEEMQYVNWFVEASEVEMPYNPKRFADWIVEVAEWEKLKVCKQEIIDAMKIADKKGMGSNIVRPASLTSFIKGNRGSKKRNNEIPKYSPDETFPAEDGYIYNLKGEVVGTV